MAENDNANKAADAIAREMETRRKLVVVCTSDDAAFHLAVALRERGFKANACTEQLWDRKNDNFTTGPCVRVSKKRDPNTPKKWDPFPRNDPLKDGPGCRRMPKDAWEKAGLSEQDYRHALRVLRLIDEDWDADEKRDSFKAYDIARVLKGYRERYERAEAALAAAKGGDHA